MHSDPSSLGKPRFRRNDWTRPAHALPKVWFEKLTPEEREIATVANRIETHIEIIGGCYLLAFFLYQFLKRESGIRATPIVGWINDGTSPIMASHAWVEFNGKKIDVALTRTEFPEIQLPGPLLILDEVVRPGLTVYTYHASRPAEAIAALHELAAAGHQVAEAEQLHFEMRRVSKNDALIERYLENAPIERTYAALARLIA